MKIAVAGTGYVGLSIATLLAQHNEVVAVDILAEKVDKINSRLSPIKDDYIEEFFTQRRLNLKATLSYDEAFADADYIVVAVPTNYDSHKNFFDTSLVEDVVNEAVRVNPTATIVIKSTVPVGFTEGLCQRLGIENILFSPEFLRESRALEDNLYPSRIIVGHSQHNMAAAEAARQFAELLKQGAFIDNVKIALMGTTEAEAVKLFANTYLALRVSYFNELDTYAETKGLNTKDIIEGRP